MNVTQTPPAPTKVHLVSWMDATEAVIEPMAVDSLNKIEDAHTVGAGNFTADLMLERKVMPFPQKMAIGVAQLGLLAGAGVAVAMGASAALGGSLVGLGVAVAGGALIYHKGSQLFLRGLGHCYSAIKDKKIGETPWSGIRTYEVTGNKTPALDGTVTSDVALAEKREIPTVSDFLANGMKKYPKEDITVVHMMGHGLGYRQTAGLGYKDYKSVVDDTVTKAGRPIDVLLLESCLEGNLEAVAGVGDKARFVLVSEETIKAGAVGDLLENTTRKTAGQTLTPEQWGREIIDSANVMSNSTDMMKKMLAPETLALVDTAQLPGVVSAVDALGGLLKNEIATNADGLKAAVKNTQLYPKMWPHRSTGEKLGMGDLGHFCRNLEKVYTGQTLVEKSGFGPFKKETQVSFPNAAASPNAQAVLAALGQVQSELNKAVLARHTADNYSEACGLSVQLPTSSLEKLDKKFMPFSDSAAPPQWKSFVTEMSDKL